ncbi:MAG: hypothetical protein ABL995_18365, partial [Bryobacteraceae bacterium]
MFQFKKFGWAALLALFLFSRAAEAQLPPCTDSTTFAQGYVYTLRTNTNNLQSYASAFVIGNYWYYWSPSVSAVASKNSAQLHAGSASAGPGGTASVVWNDLLSSTGPGTYSISSTHVYSAWCGTNTSYGFAQNTVQKPTITLPQDGIAIPNALWNLGPGTLDFVPTSNGYAYRQKISLGVDKHCLTVETCTDTPNWTINSPASTLVLSASAGNSVFLQKGSSMGNCAYDTTVSVKAGASPGFSSDNVTFGVNSP